MGKLDNQLSRYGAISKQLPFTLGKIFFVKSSSDADYGDVLSEFGTDADGVVRVYTTFALAAAATVANRYDIVIVPDSTYMTSVNQALLASTARMVIMGDSMDAGSTFWLKKTLVSSTLTTSAQDLTTVSAGGELEVENVIVKTNGTGLAGATNFRILSNNANGLAAILEEAVSALGANKTIDINSASVVKQRTVLESGKKFQFLGTASSGTGAGTIDVYIKLRRLTAGATISVV